MNKNNKDAENILHEILFIVFSQQRLIVNTAIIIFIAVLAVSFLAPKKYVSQASLLVKGKRVERNPELITQFETRRLPITSEDLNSELQIITSSEVIKQSITELAQTSKIFSLPGEINDDDELQSPELIKHIKKIRSSLDVNIVPSSKILNVSLRWGNAKEAKHILDVLLKHYFIYRNTVYKPKQIKNFYDKTVTSYQESIDQEDEKLAQIIEKIKATSAHKEIESNLGLKKEYSQQLGLLEQSYLATNAAVSHLTKQLIMVKNNEFDPDHIILFSNLDNIPIRELATAVHTDLANYRDIRKHYKLSSTKASLASNNLKRSYNLLIKEVDSIASKQKDELDAIINSINFLKQQILKIDTRNTELAKLQISLEKIERDKTLLEQSFSNYYRLREETNMSEKTQTASLNTQVILLSPVWADQSAVFPNKKVLIPFGFIISVLVGLTAGFIKEYFDDTIKRPGDSIKFIGKPTILSFIDQSPKEPRSIIEAAWYWLSGKTQESKISRTHVMLIIAMSGLSYYLLTMETKEVNQINPLPNVTTHLSDTNDPQNIVETPTKSAEIGDTTKHNELIVDTPAESTDDTETTRHNELIVDTSAESTDDTETTKHNELIVDTPAESTDDTETTKHNELIVDTPAEATDDTDTSKHNELIVDTPAESTDGTETTTHLIVDTPAEATDDTDTTKHNDLIVDTPAESTDDTATTKHNELIVDTPAEATDDTETTTHLIVDTPAEATDDTDTTKHNELIVDTPAKSTDDTDTTTQTALTVEILPEATDDIIDPNSKFITEDQTDNLIDAENNLKPVDVEETEEVTDAINTQAPSDSEDNRYDNIFLTSKWAIQLGVFGNKKNINRLEKKLNKENLNTFTQPLKKHPDRFTLVYAGPYDTKRGLKDIQEKISNITQLKGKITNVITGQNPDTELTEINKNSIVKTLENWSHAWSEKKSNDYFSTYLPSTSPMENKSLKSWMYISNKRLRRTLSVNLNSSTYGFQRQSADQIKVQFWLTFLSADYHDKIFKQLGLIKQNEQWYIFDEKDLLIDRTINKIAKINGSKLVNTAHLPTHLIGS